jgi:hypothetical protein
MITTNANLEQEYRLIRIDFANAELDVNGSIDSLYRDWRRWRDKSEVLSLPNRVAIDNADQWWARHLAQFRSLIDPLHMMARAERAHKDCMPAPQRRS